MEGGDVDTEQRNKNIIGRKKKSNLVFNGVKILAAQGF